MPTHLLTVRSEKHADLGILLLRVMMGVVFLYAAWGDLFDMGLSNVVEGHRGAGIPLPEVSAPYTAFMQLIGGALLIVGGLTRLVPFGLLVIMVGAVFFVHLEEGFAGYQFPLTLAVACVTLILTGPGRYSLDQWLVSRRTAVPQPSR